MVRSEMQHLTEMQPSTPLLEVTELEVTVGGLRRPVPAVRGVSFSLCRGETLCVVGESGSGKSLTALALMQLLPAGAQIRSQRFFFDGEDLLKATQSQIRKIRGRDIAMIFQDPMTSLNPVRTIGDQMIEAYLAHIDRDRTKAWQRAIFLLNRVGISNAHDRMSQYPHQLSGGLRQRIMIAMALMCSPRLLIADEPTTALDVTIQAQVLALIREIQQELDLGLIFITHDLGVVARIADRVSVMYAGQIVETGSAQAIFRAPLHPYTRSLLNCLPGGTNQRGRLNSIKGNVPSLSELDGGCSFRNRCYSAHRACEGPVYLNLGHDGRETRCLLRTTEMAEHHASD